MQKEIMEKYLRWCNEKTLLDEERKELKALAGNETEIMTRFVADLEFGTAGLRGVMGLGTNMMNKYIVRRATQGLANYLLKTNKAPSVAIAYDSRNNSDLYAKEAANVLASNGIKAHIYKELMPVPALSFATRYLKCDAGIAVTASHNPKQYNGYKVYGSDGCQMTTESANAVLNEILKLDIFDDVKLGSFDELVSKGMINFINQTLIDDYYKSTLEQSLDKSERIVKIAYTPLYGAGRKPVLTVLDMDGFKNIDVVKEQLEPNGNFPTCPYPNPEMAPALELGIKRLIENNNDVLLATDPDSDRVGVAVNQNGNPVILTGNEVGILLFDFVYNVRKLHNNLPDRPFMVKTIVSSDIISIMGKKYGVEIKDVLTGFKFIGEQMLFLERKGELNRYIFGFEESCGYLTNHNVRDKDAVNACLLVAEMANFYKHKGFTLVDRLNQIYEEFGEYKTATLNFQFEGLDGKETMANLMKEFRTEKVQKAFEGFDHYADYLIQKVFYKDHEEETGLPSSNVVKYFLSNNETIIFRPSGTEPKLKAYIFSRSENLDKYKELVSRLINK